jgi:hypothetical protein
MKALILIATLCLPGAVLADTDNFSISADQWALPRSGAALLHLAPFSAAVQDWVAHPGARIVIVHAGSDQANLWAGELSDWLVALGVPAEQIDRRVSGDQGEDSITLLVER